MAAKDAEMPDHYPLDDEVKEIAKHLAGLRKEMEGLTGSIAPPAVTRPNARRMQ
jgi:hypothetical protein